MATGVYGGVGTNGLINANFFVDRVLIPDSQIITLNENGEQVGSPLDDKNGDLAREVQCGLIMDVVTAKIVANWLNEKIKEYESITKPNKRL